MGHAICELRSHHRELPVSDHDHSAEAGNHRLGLTRALEEAFSDELCDCFAFCYNNSSGWPGTERRNGGKGLCQVQSVLSLPLPTGTRLPRCILLHTEATGLHQCERLP